MWHLTVSHVALIQRDLPLRSTVTDLKNAANGTSGEEDGDSIFQVKEAETVKQCRIFNQEMSLILFLHMFL